MAFSIKFAAGMVEKILEGKSDLGEILLTKLESMGEDLIMDVVGGPLAQAQRVEKLVATGGHSEFDKARSKFLNGFRPRPLPHAGIIKKFGGLYQTRDRARVRRNRNMAGQWQGSSWASSRDEWLDKQWQHDWRSQPRDVLGRWIPGRLDYIAASLQYRGRRAGRLTLRRRKLRKMRKLTTRRILRKLMKQTTKNRTGDAT